MILSENRLPPSDQVRGQAFSGSCSNGATGDVERKRRGIRHVEAFDGAGQVEAGEAVEIITPTGGGWGRVPLAASAALQRAFFKNARLTTGYGARLQAACAPSVA